MLPVHELTGPKCNIHMIQVEWEAVIKWKTGKKEMLTA